MGWEAWATLAIVAGVFIGLVRRMGPPDVILMGGAITVGVLGIIPVEDVFSGFTNPGMLTIAALFVVAAAMRETGALDSIGTWLLGRSSNEHGVLWRIAGPVTAMSAFLNNTPVVAMLVPVLQSWCRKHRVSPSRVLLPLSYMAILGGTCTLIGTSTNIIVDGLVTDAARSVASNNPESPLLDALAPLALFEFSWVGVPFVFVGLVYILTVGRRLLPDRKHLIEKLGESTRDYLVDMRIEPGCRLTGRQVAEAGLRHLPGLFLIEIVREDHVITPVRPDEVLRAGDVLTFTGVVSTIVDLERIGGLVPVADTGYEVRAQERRNKTLCEAVVSPRAPSIGKCIRDAQFRATYNAAVIAVHRGGHRLRGRVGDIVLEAGDTLLLQGGDHFVQAYRNSPDFFLVSGVADSRPVRHEKTALSVALLALLVGLLVTRLMPVVLAAYIVAGLMILTRCISASHARQNIDWQTLLTIGAAFALGKALDQSGCAAVLAGLVASSAGLWGPYAALALTYAITALFTETVTNRAAVVLMFPIALSIAQQLGVSPRPFIMAITFAAASSVVTPLGYQTNLMVYGPGGYRFGDFVRVGLPLAILLMITALAIIPWVWPF